MKLGYTAWRLEVKTIQFGRLQAGAIRRAENEQKLTEAPSTGGEVKSLKRRAVRSTSVTGTGMRSKRRQEHLMDGTGGGSTRVRRGKHGWAQGRRNGRLAVRKVQESGPFCICIPSQDGHRSGRDTTPRLR
ncbi:hypothetical protein HYQ46_007702 [Verticillium longisporum]|nr:hypothetical protein HYQ46_007702 [Verticillium longisporum]